MGVITVNHPLVQHKLTELRKKETPTLVFRALTAEIGMMLGYEATRDLGLHDIAIETPVESTRAPVISGKTPALVSILRAGNGLLDGVLRLLPNAKVGHIGMERDETTHRPRPYYCKVPKRLEERLGLVCDPMLATGHSALESISQLKALGAKNIRFLCLLAAPEGIAALTAAHPDVPIYTAHIDRQLNERAYICPGLGDAGDRLYGTL